MVLRDSFLFASLFCRTSERPSDAIHPKRSSSLGFNIEGKNKRMQQFSMISRFVYYVASLCLLFYFYPRPFCCCCMMRLANFSLSISDNFYVTPHFCWCRLKMIVDLRVHKRACMDLYLYSHTFLHVLFSIWFAFCCCNIEITSYFVRW